MPPLPDSTSVAALTEATLTAEHDFVRRLARSLLRDANDADDIAQQAMIEVAKLRQMTLDPNAHVPGAAVAWDLITRGNADALGFHDMGRIEAGASADLLVLRVPFEVDEHLIGRLIHTWRDEFINHRVLKGKLLK